MTFAIFAIICFVFISLLFNIGRLAFRSIIKIFNLTVSVGLLLFIASFVHAPEDTILALTKILATIGEIIRVLAA